MAEQLTLCIQTPFKKEDIAIEWVQIQSPSGSFIVGPNHQPLVSALTASSVIVYRTSGQDKEVTVGEGGGLAHVGDNMVRLFL